MHKTIVYLTYDGLMDPLGQSQILPYVLSLNKHPKFSFIIISFEKKQNNSDKITLEKMLKSKNIEWLILNYTKNPPIVSTLFDLIKLNKEINKIKKTIKIDLLHCRSYLTSLIGLRKKNKFDIPFLFDMRGFYADERIDGKIWNKNNILYNMIYKFFKYKEKHFLKQANHTVSLTYSGEKEINSWNLKNQSLITVIPCCTDEKLFNVKSINNIRQKIGIEKDDFIISYIGSIGTWYMLDEMLDFFSLFLQKMPNAKFLFVTKDNPKEILNKTRNKKIPISSIIIKESCRKMMPSYIGISNFSIFFIIPAYSKKASSPTKMGEIMNLGIPIICNSGVGDVDEVMKQSMPELLVKEFNNKEYERVIDLTLNDFKPNRKIIKQTSHNYYSLNNGVRKYLDIYKKIFN